MENHSLLRDETNSQKLFQHAFYITNKEECLCFSIFSIRAVKTRLCATAINRRLNISEVRWDRWERRAPEDLWGRKAHKVRKGLKAQLARQELQVPSVQREQRVQPGRKGLKASKVKPVRRAQPDRKVLPDLKARKEYRVKRVRPVLKVPSVRKESRAQAHCKTHCMPTAVRKRLRRAR